MKYPFYIILGPSVDGECSYWLEGYGWTHDLRYATRFSADVLTRPLPPGAGQIIHYHDEHRTSIVSPIGVGSKVFQEYI